jgi:uncharacterized RDD family membrane protein YckC
MERVGFGPRLGAALLDSVFLLAIVALFLWLGAWAFTILLIVDNERHSLATLLLSLVPITYGMFEIFRGATFGKMVLGLSIRRDDGAPAPRSLLFERWALKNGPTLLHFVAINLQRDNLTRVAQIVGSLVVLGCFYMCGASKQAAHDKIAGTAVCRL